MGINNLGEIEEIKKIDNTFKKNVSSQTFNYLNYQNDSDKRRLKDKFLKEGYACIHYYKSVSEDYKYDFFNLELVNDGNQNIEHNVEVQLSNSNDNKIILNCCFNLSLATRKSNLIKTREMKVKKQDVDICMKDCKKCKLNDLIKSFSDYNQIIFPSNYKANDFYINNELELKSKNDSSKERRHILMFEVNSNINMYKEVEKILKKVIDENLITDREIKLLVINPPRYYLTIIVINHLLKSHKRLFTARRLLNSAKQKIETLTPN